MANYYVSTTGSNLSAGTDPDASPWRTLNFAVPRLVAGDTLFVRAGIYAEALQYVIPSGTSWVAPVKIQNYNGEVVWMRPTSADNVVSIAGTPATGGNIGESKYIWFDGINMDASLTLGNTVKLESGPQPGSPLADYNAHHIRIWNAELIGTTLLENGVLNGSMIIMIACLNERALGFYDFKNLVLHHCGGLGTFGYGIYWQGSDSTATNIEIYDTNGAGIQLYNGYVHDLQASRNTLDGIYVHDLNRTADTRIDGIIIGAGVDNLIKNFKVDGVSAAPDIKGIYLYKGARNKLYNGLVTNVAGGFGIYVENTSTDCEVKNVISHNNTTNYRDVGVGTLALTNMMLGVDPQWMNPAAKNYHLRSTSPALNAGTTLASVTTDFDGLSRPQQTSYAIGPYEPNAGTITVVATPAISTWTVPDPTLSHGVTTFTPSSAVSTWTVPDPVVSTGQINIAATPVISTWTVPDPTLSTGTTTIVATPAISTWTVPAPDLAVTPITITATPAISTWTVPAPTLTPSPITITPDPAISTWVVGAAQGNVASVGDMIYRGADGLWHRVQGNTAALDYVLTQTGDGSVSAAPRWEPPSGSGGDVVGPASATDGNLAVFDGTTGKLIKDGGAPSGAGTVTNTGALTDHNLIVANGGVDVSALGDLGTTTTVLHGNAAGDPSFATVVEADMTLTDNTTGNVTSSAHGFAPKAPADATKFLNGANPPAYALVKDSDLSTSNVTTNNVTTAKHGFAPILPNDATKYLDGTGAYTVPAGSGLITQAVVAASDDSDSDNTLHNDPELFFSAAASAVYIIEMFLQFTSGSSTPDNKSSFTLPASSTLSLTVFGLDTAASGSTAIIFGSTNAESSPSSFGRGIVAGAVAGVWIKGLLRTGSAGTVQYQWSQNTTNATATVRKADSYLKYTRVS